MIDPADKQTLALPLDDQPPKRKRGRPVTGAAMTPAEKQRAYRARIKAELEMLREQAGPRLRHPSKIDAWED